MDRLIRNISLSLRQRGEARDVQTVLAKFNEWRLSLAGLPENTSRENKLALVRLDDIGDYLLFRNFLPFYRQSERFKRHNVTLIGNIAWKSIFDRYGIANIDNSIWVDKHLYLTDGVYRTNVWQQIRSENFGTVICPSRTRPLLIDDLIALASDAPNLIGCENSFASISLNKTSDRCYDELFPASAHLHEFLFNREFATAVTQASIEIDAPFLPPPEDRGSDQNSVVCFVGASASSKKWPIKNWIRLIGLLQENGHFPLLAGGKGETDVATRVQEVTQAASIVGKTDLVQTLETIGRAKAVITGDTMASHVGVSFQTPTVILSNGVNATRFVGYEEAGFDFVIAVYTRQYQTSSAKEGGVTHAAVTKDMHSITPETAYAAFSDLLARVRSRCHDPVGEAVHCRDNRTRSAPRAGTSAV